jgi:hypothetical protein
MERSGIAAHIKDPANGSIITHLSKLMLFHGATQALGRVCQHVINEGFLMLIAGASNRSAGPSRNASVTGAKQLSG